MAEWLKAAVLKTVEYQSSVGSNPTSSANLQGEMAELAEGARLLSECVVKAAPRVRIPLSPPISVLRNEDEITYMFLKINISYPFIYFSKFTW